MKNPFDNLPASDDEDNSKFINVASKTKQGTLPLIQMQDRKGLFNKLSPKPTLRIPDQMSMTIWLSIRERTPSPPRETGNRSL